MTTRPADTAAYTYEGSELELFALAKRWKAYLRAAITPFLRRPGHAPRVLEVGAGIGATTAVLCDGSPRDWLCLEPDDAMARRLRDALAAGSLPPCCRVLTGTTADLLAAEHTPTPADPPQRFDAILYIDVLEHIDDHRAELARAARLLAPGGHAIVLSPAHQSLFSPFDHAIGHRRRYTRRSLADAGAAIDTPGVRMVLNRYLDAAGLLASAANRLLLKQSMPTPAQIRTWDTFLVPLSRWALDPLTLGRLGKSVLGAWRRD